MAREYDIANPASRCCRCDRQLAPGEEFLARLVDEGASFRREDVCAACGSGASAAEGAFSVWRCRVPEPRKPRRQLVGDEALIDLFEKLQHRDEPAKVRFRFVLALMLMRKKLLIYDRIAAGDDGEETWEMHYKGRTDPVAVTHPELDDEKIAEVAAQLAAIFEVPT